jgi:NADPH-dependent ferric siderophore reductase
MSLTRSRWVLPVLSACTAAAMFASPIAWADDDKGRGGGDRGRGDEEGRRVTFVAPAPATTVVQRRDDDENEDQPAVAASATPLVSAINAEVATLTNLNAVVDDEGEAEDAAVEDVNVVNLAGLEAGLPADQAALVTAAANANAAALRTFLAGTSANAVSLSAALRRAGVDPTTVLAVLVADEHELIAVTG